MKIRRFFYGGLGLIGLLLLAWWLTSSAFKTSPAVEPDYIAFSWGANDYGQLGDGTTTEHKSPIVIALPAGVSFSSLSGGLTHSLAIGNDSKLYSWGANNFGQLGDGTTTPHSKPALVSLPAGVNPKAVAAAGNEIYPHSLALGSDGNLYAWGFNRGGELGDGTLTTRYNPVLVKLPAAVKTTAIAAGFTHSLALGSDGKLYAWGSNSSGQLGDGTTTDRATPVIVSLPAGVVPAVIAAGYDHSLVIGNDGNLYAWGNNSHGQIGNRVESGIQTSPVRVEIPGGVKVIAIAAGANHSLAIGNDGKLYSWGFNQGGQWSASSTNDRPSPGLLNLPSGVNAKAIAVNGLHNLAIGSDGNLYAWGWNKYGQVGDGTNTNYTNPVLIKLPGGSIPISIAAGGGYSFAIARPSTEFANSINKGSATARP